MSRGAFATGHVTRSVRDRNRAGIEAANPALRADQQLRFQLDFGREHPP
eukprot:gene26670-biopygen17118